MTIHINNKINTQMIANDMGTGAFAGIITAATVADFTGNYSLVIPSGLFVTTAICNTTLISEIAQKKFNFTNKQANALGGFFGGLAATAASGSAYCVMMNIDPSISLITGIATVTGIIFGGIMHQVTPEKKLALKTKIVELPV